MSDFARAVCEARDAYEAWVATGKEIGEISEGDPDYVRVRRAGEVLGDLGGITAMTAALTGFYEGEAEYLEAGRMLNWLWDGLHGWYG
ncbi:hypothetical protein QTO30_20785 [Yoonia sp. GPGPB17]|uniref:hypothetical protein n=1 Tax=Yoonia sp. GPGPB17 TaxID=3026147 RepID=UPI0030C4B719